MRMLLVGLVLGLLAAPSRSTQAGPKYWRLRCSEATSESWHLCDLKFSGDTLCDGPLLSGGIQGVTAQFNHESAGAATSRFAVGQSGALRPTAVYDEWKSGCSSCAADEAFVGAGFSSGTVVQCVQYSECAPVLPATTTTEGEPTTTATTSTLTTTVPTTTNPFLDIGWPGGRRLQGFGGCTHPVLERSNDLSLWSVVAGWESPASGVDLSLASATHRPVPDLPTVTATNPQSVTSCSSCGSLGHGARSEVFIEFSSWVYPGGGEIHIERSGLSTLVLDSGDGAWFDYEEMRLTIRPRQELGLSGGCVTVKLRNGAVIDIDGNGFQDYRPWKYCIADTVPPEWLEQFSEPAQNSASAGEAPRIQLSFNEPVQIAPTASVATLESAVGTQSLELVGGGSAAAQVRTTTWDSGRQGMVELDITGPLQPNTQYTLRIPGGAVTDMAGNAWPGGALTFSTRCVSGCDQMPGITTTGGASTCSDTNFGSTNVYHRGCDDYVLSPDGCGEYDDDDFSSNTMCCACGGGTAYSGEEEESGGFPIFLIILLVTVGIFCVAAGAFLRYFLHNHMPGSAPKTKVRDISASGAGSGAAQPQRSLRSSATSPAFDVRKTASGPRHAGQAAAGGNRPPAGAGPTPPGSAQGYREPPRAREAEDAAGDEHWRKPTDKPKRTAYTDDHAVGGGWVKAIDPQSGKPFWTHYKTKEVRWSAPVHDGQSAAAPPPRKGAPHQAWGSGEPRRGSAGAESQRRDSVPSTAPPEKELTPEEKEAARQIAEIEEQLQKTKKEDIASRKKTFKFLQLRWHPDKHNEDKELATKIFQYLQTQKDWYLKE